MVQESNPQTRGILNQERVHSVNIIVMPEDGSTVGSGRVLGKAPVT